MLRDWEAVHAACFTSNVGGKAMTLQRMDNVLIVVDDLAAAKAFCLFRSCRKHHYI